MDLVIDKSKLADKVAEVLKQDVQNDDIIDLLARELITETEAAFRLRALVGLSKRTALKILLKEMSAEISGDTEEPDHHSEPLGVA